MVVVYTNPKLEMDWKRRISNMHNLQFIDQNDTKISKTDQYNLWIYRHQVNKLPELSMMMVLIMQVEWKHIS